MIQTLAFLLPIFLASVVIFWLLPIRIRYGFLAAASFGMLAFLDPVGIAVLGGITLLFYAGTKWDAASHHHSFVIPILVTGILAYLLYFKYLSPVVAEFTGSAGQVAIPLGISYFTFKLIHFAIESRRGVLSNISFQQFCCYIFILPIFTAGPIERYDHFTANQESSFQLGTTIDGLTRIIHGLIKKFVLAELIARELGGTDHLYEFARILDHTPVYELWMFGLFTYIYVYLDFSAYSDMAVGACRLYGIRIAENFNWPIVASNIVEFWQRWHITLRTWCQSYIYLPVIALSRNPYLALYLTFLAMGLWHSGSWNYLCWGIYHATGVAIFQAWRRTTARKWLVGKNSMWTTLLGVAITNAFICGSHIWSVSSQASVLDRLRILVRMFCFLILSV